MNMLKIAGKQGSLLCLCPMRIFVIISCIFAGKGMIYKWKIWGITTANSVLLKK